MSELFLPPDQTASVIEVGGSCYQYVGPSSQPPNTSQPDAVYDDCNKCANPCGDCASCNITANISNGPGCCACINTSVPLTSSGECVWRGSVTLGSESGCPSGRVDVTLECEGRTWSCTVSGGSLCDGSVDQTWQGTGAGNGDCPPPLIWCTTSGGTECTQEIEVTFS